jgi:lipopolysaccharide assembly outer membrane protein LptD (OstA)
MVWSQPENPSAQKPGTQSKSGSMLDFPIDYQAQDTIKIFIRQKKEILIGKARVAYQNIELTADYIEIDFAKNEVYATGMLDSTGQMAGFPVFKEGQDQFEARAMRYNFNTKKGLIQDVVTVQDGGFLHSSITKKHTKSVIDMKKGKYTTCDHEHPHFYIALTKARVIQNEKIVAGPAYLVIEDIPTPIAIPFGFFPFTKEQASGLIIPGYGDSRERGFYLTNGGYYWAGNEYFDLKATGSIYSKGSWDFEARSRYKVRYKFNGNLSYRKEKIILGEKGASDEVNRDAYAFVWNHFQDAKANPNQRFGANVNLRSTSSNIYSTNLNNYIQNTVSSDISYQRNFPGTPFSLTANAKHVLNTLDTSVTLTLPTATINMARQTPFARKDRIGKQRWYETVGITYNSNLQNSGKMHERDFFTNRMNDKFKYGVNHNLSSNASIKVLKHLNIAPGVSYKERWYFDRLDKTLIKGTRPDSLPVDPPIRDTVVMDTTKGFYRVWDYSTSVSMSTTVYGMFKFHPKLPVEAIRVVHRPSVGLSYRPDFGDPKYGYVNVDTLPAMTYNRYANGLFGTPPVGKSQSISFSLDNNLEMKIRTPRDSVNRTKKITIFDAIGLNTSYNAAADSMNWSPLNFNARTRLFNLLNFSFNGNMDWYALDEITKKRIDEFQYNFDKRLGRLTSASLTANFSINSTTFSKKDGKSTGTLEPTDYNYYYNYFDIPWSINVGYTYSYSKPTTDKRVVQNINLSGDFSVTKKWKINYTTGYDIDRKQISLTNLGITRDLHCWVMRFEWVPFGERQSYFFTIGVKSSILQDLKYDKREFYFDTVR